MCNWKNGTRYRNWEKQPCFFCYSLEKKTSPRVYFYFHLFRCFLWEEEGIEGGKDGGGKKGKGTGKENREGEGGGRLFMLMWFVLLLLAYSSYAQVFISYVRMTLFRFPIVGKCQQS